jgi:hypothetical protein
LLIASDSLREPSGAEEADLNPSCSIISKPFGECARIAQVEATNRHGRYKVIGLVAAPESEGGGS